MSNTRTTLLRSGKNGFVLAVIQPRHPGGAHTFASLSPRERDVAALIGGGRTNRQIARELYLSVTTVKDHVHHILTKTGAR